MANWDNEDDTGNWGEEEVEEDSMPEAWGDEQREPARNPIITAQADKLIHSQPVKTQLPKQKHKPAKEDLLVQYDQQGRPAACCRMVKGPDGKPRQTSAWRPPTADEYNAIMLRAKNVQGGVVGSKVSASTNVRGQMEMVPLGEIETPIWKKAAKVGVGIAVIGGLGYWGYRQFGQD